MRYIILLLSISIIGCDNTLYSEGSITEEMLTCGPGTGASPELSIQVRTNFHTKEQYVYLSKFCQSTGRVEYLLSTNFSRDE